jgi:hypothetical protein
MDYGTEEGYKEREAKQLVASKLEELALQVSKHAESSALGVRERLSIVSTPEEDSVAKENAPQEVWPPYFATLRDLLESIDRKLSNIDISLRRLEL